MNFGAILLVYDVFDVFNSYLNFQILMILVSVVLMIGSEWEICVCLMSFYYNESLRHGDEEEIG